MKRGMKERGPSPQRRDDRRRRRSSVPGAVAGAAGFAWQEWLVGIGALAIGIGAGLFGLSDLSVWIDAMRRDAPVIRTGSMMFALPLFGIGFLSLSALAPLSRLGAARRERWTGAAFGLFLASVVIGMLLMIAGPFVIGAVMTRHHHACQTRAGFRTVYVTWAYDGRPCPA